MSDPKSSPRRSATPLPALQAALTDAATDPVRRALWLDALEQKLRPCLPPPLADHCRLANVAEGGRLVFIVDSPIWRARLRLAAPDILDVARSIGLAATEVAIKTAIAPFAPAATAAGATRPLSETARSSLAAALATLEESVSRNPAGASGDRRGGRKR
ncbi:DciA family protein [Pseudoxanthomonas mexicana]|uniref:DciA family protein n=1 Tax=Pseudoxanthomonas mexicana TaxID=128785 RepID=UPI00398A5D2A